MALIENLINLLLKPNSRFKTGDHVQSFKGGPLMIVQWIKVDKKNHVTIVSCKWFDNETKSNRTNIFVEEDLTPFDWHNP
jgi:uncharacterized protein YodC (DUF2158 family)